MASPTATTSLPPVQRALKVEGPGQVALASQVPLPNLKPDEVLVQVASIALNPYDGKSLDMSPSPGATVGCDFAGTVVTLGEDVDSASLRQGDRVCGIVWGNNPARLDNGACAEFVAIPASFVFRIPPEMSFTQAATLSSGLAAAGLAVYQGLGLPMKATKADWVLVYGGGTATGTIAIQILRQSGFRVLVTCSPRHNARLQQLGAEMAFDYQTPTCGPDIREFTEDKLAFALDCITNSASMKLCYEAIGTSGGRYMGLDPFPLHVHTRRSIQPDWIFLFTQFGEPVPWERPFNFDARPRDKAFAEGWYRVAEKLLADGHIKPHPFQLEPGGLEAVADGIDAVHKGQVAGYKLVYSI